MQLKGARVAVTGAAGFLGAYIVRALVARGARVRAVARSAGQLAHLRGIVDDTAAADLTDEAAAVAALAGASAVVHAAGMYVWRPVADDVQRAANVTTIANVMRGAAAHGLKRVVHISSFGVYRMQRYVALPEDAPHIDGTHDDERGYRASKELGERAALALAERLGVPLTLLRPTGMYGARDALFVPLIRAALQRRAIARPLSQFPLVYAGDVARAAVGALENDYAAGRAYNTGGAPIANRALLGAFARAEGTRALVLPLPLPLPLLVDNFRAERDLGFTNRPFDEAIDDLRALERTAQARPEQPS